MIDDAPTATAMRNGKAIEGANKGFIGKGHTQPTVTVETSNTIIDLNFYVLNKESVKVSHGTFQLASDMGSSKPLVLTTNKKEDNSDVVNGGSSFGYRRT